MAAQAAGRPAGPLTSIAAIVRRGVPVLFSHALQGSAQHITWRGASSGANNTCKAALLLAAHRPLARSRRCHPRALAAGHCPPTCNCSSVRGSSDFHLGRRQALTAAPSCSGSSGSGLQQLAPMLWQAMAAAVAVGSAAAAVGPDVQRTCWRCVQGSHSARRGRRHAGGAPAGQPAGCWVPPAP